MIALITGAAFSNRLCHGREVNGSARCRV